MPSSLAFLLLFFFLVERASAIAIAVRTAGEEEEDGSSDRFYNTWIISLVGEEGFEGGGGEEGVNRAADEAQLIALRRGYEYVGEIARFPGHFLLRKTDHPDLNRDGSVIFTKDLEMEDRVLWAQQLFAHLRVKRDYVYLDNDVDFANVEREFATRRLLARMTPEELGQMVQEEDEGEDDEDDAGRRGIPMDLLRLWDEEDGREDEDDVNKNRLFNDELWGHQWYMQPNRMSSRSTDGSRKADLHVVEAFRLGYSGKGVRVNVLDDGLEHTHRDLAANYDPSISWDYNSGGDGDPDPSPRYPEDRDDPGAVPNSHGTRCAGEIAMVANNGFCGVGVAYNAKIGGVRMLDGSVDDHVEALALSHARDKVDIYTASWGPSDDGKTVEAPGKLARRALEQGVKKGRGGKGSIYVWASGNGGAHGDNCNCDGYTSSRYTLSIGSVTENGDFPWYGERCASTMAATFSSGSFEEEKVATTDTNNTCTVSHTGTSAAAPLAAGIIALALEANPDLTWRDVQHLAASTADPEAIRPEGETNRYGDGAGTANRWRKNAAGLKYSDGFGFGVLDALRMVQAAERWEGVGRQVEHHEKGRSLSKSSNLRSSEAFSAEFDVEPRDTKMRFLEHVQLTASVKYPIRGALEIALVSPAGTVSPLLSPRPEDRSDAGFQQWDFSSVHFWGEDPRGKWRVYVADTGSDPGADLYGEVSDLRLGLFGAEEAPRKFKETMERFGK